MLHLDIDQLEHPLHGWRIVAPLVFVGGNTRRQLLLVAVVDGLLQSLDALHARLVHGDSLATRLTEAVHPFVLTQLFSQRVCFGFELLL